MYILYESKKPHLNFYMMNATGVVETVVLFIIVINQLKLPHHKQSLLLY